MSGPMSPGAPFFAAAVRTSLPLWLWAGHFAFCYVAVAVGCHAGWHEAAWHGASALRWALAGASALALAAAVALLGLACRSRPGPARPLQDVARRLVAVMALVGIAWTTWPALWLPACQPS